jgi:hypothetical protein
MRIGRACILVVFLFTLGAANAQVQACQKQGTWSQENYFDASYYRFSSPLLLTDGRVMAQYIGGGPAGGHPWEDWYALTPSETGCYSLNPANCPGGQAARWNELASLNSLYSGAYSPSAFASAVLPDGKVIIEGGEDVNGEREVENPNKTTNGAIYDPKSNTWKEVPPPAGWTTIADAPSTVLADGTYMLGNACGNSDGIGEVALYNEKANSWNTMINQPPETTAEASFTLLPDKSVIFVGTCWPTDPEGDTCTQLGSTNPNNAELFTPGTDPANGVWSSAGDTTAQLYSWGFGQANSCATGTPAFGEQGPAALLPGNTYFATGGRINEPPVDMTVHTSMYKLDSALGAWEWEDSPDLPEIPLPVILDNKEVMVPFPLTAEDSGSVVLPNGKYLISSTVRDYNLNFANPITYLVFDPGEKSYCRLNLPAGAIYQAEFLTLPTGQIMVTSVSWSGDENYFLYSPPKVDPYPNIAPELASVDTSTQVNGLPELIQGYTYKASGKRFNGATQASFLGDDFQNATNYPLIRFTGKTSGLVYYARTYDHSTMAVDTKDEVTTTMFDMPGNIASGQYDMVVVANGIASNTLSVQLYGSAITGPPSPTPR